MNKSLSASSDEKLLIGSAGSRHKFGGFLQGMFAIFLCYATIGLLPIAVMGNREHDTTIKRLIAMLNIVTPEYLNTQGFRERFWSKIDKNGPVPEHMPHLGPCWIWTAFKTPAGYGKIATTRPFYPIFAHHASWIIHFGPIPHGLWVLHKCDTPPCLRPDHLFLGTCKDNCNDRDSKGRGRIPRGEEHGSHKLTTVEVVKIRDLYAAGGISQRALGEMFRVSERAVHWIVHRRHWAHI